MVMKIDLVIIFFASTPHRLDVMPVNSVKIILELNQETARYCTLVVGLGASQDSCILRDELKRSRLRVHDLAKLNKMKLIPLLKNKLLGGEDLRELERLHTIFSACLELMEIQLKRTAHLQRIFPLHSGTTVLINTGFSECIISKHTASSEQLDNSLLDRGLIEKEDFGCLEREINELREMVFDINQTIPIQPWAIEPDIETDRYNTDKSTASNSSSMDVTTVTSRDRKRRRCVCVVIFVMTAVIISASIVGVCLGVLQ
ncbi:hypothetical protein ScPMuIL_018610 [Solemya velum]